MDWNQRKNLMLRWSVINTILIGGFWGWHWHTTGDMPGVKMIGFIQDGIGHYYQLPFTVLRIYDTSLGIIGPVVFFSLYNDTPKFDYNCAKNDYDRVISILFYILNAGMAMGILIGITYDILWFIVISLIITLTSCLSIIIITTTLHVITLYIAILFQMLLDVLDSIITSSTWEKIIKWLIG